MKGIAPFSAGVVASDGFEIVHARYARALPIGEAFARVDGHLASVGRPAQALCGMELRSPRPFTFDGFREFNAGYVKFLEQRGILLDGLNPVARTNVAPEVAAPAEPVIYAFSYTVPSANSRRSFVVAGAGEVREGSLDAAGLVRRGETSLDALREKAAFVLGLMDGRMGKLGASWEEVTVVDVYTVHDFAPLLADLILPATGNGAHGVVWHYTRPPVVEIEYEMDVRGCAREIVIS